MYLLFFWMLIWKLQHLHSKQSCGLDVEPVFEAFTSEISHVVWMWNRYLWHLHPKQSCGLDAELIFVAFTSKTVMWFGCGTGICGIYIQNSHVIWMQNRYLWHLHPKQFCGLDVKRKFETFTSEIRRIE